MTKKLPAFQFYTGDWMKDPQVSMCAPATRGIWIDLLCAMHDSGQSGEITGTVEQLARLCRCSPDEMTAAIDDLAVTFTADVTKCNGRVTLVCRRMKKEAKARVSSRLRVAEHRVKRQCNGVVTPPSSSSSSISSSETSTYAGISADAETPDSEPKRVNGTRIREDFRPDDKSLEWAAVRTPDIDLDHHTEVFLNYWLSATGQRARKMDWQLTWRNWMLKEQERMTTHGTRQPKKLTYEQSIRDALALLDQEYPE